LFAPSIASKKSIGGMTTDAVAKIAEIKIAEIVNEDLADKAK
jgi:hypothetical protein